MRNLVSIALLLCAGILMAPLLRAELVVIVNTDSGVKSMDDSDLVNIFMGRYQKLPSGVTAFPVDLQERRDAFYKTLVNKTLPEVNSYWARLVFSGRASPPRQVQEAAEVVEIVSSNLGAIGYVERELVGEGVTIVHSLMPRAASID